jgi:integrase
MATKRLNDEAVKRLNPTERKEEYWDTFTKGLVLRVAPTGHKSWCFAYRVKGVAGQQRLTFGGFPDITVAAAREIVRTYREDIARGIDPKAKREEQLMEQYLKEQEAITVEKMSEDFIEKYAKPKNRGWKATQGLFKKHIIPELGRMPVKDVQRKDVIKLLDKIKASPYPHPANHVLVALRKMYNWAIERDELQSNPCYKISKPIATNERERVLSESEIKALWKACDTIGYPYGPMFKLLLLTGARRSEIAELEWRHIDLKDKVIRLPASMIKANRSHDIPLSDIAVAILEALPRFKGPYVFSSTFGQKAVNCFTKAKDKFDETMGSDDWRIHDIRRTCATGMAEAGVPIYTISRILNHAEGGVTRLYARHSYLNEKRAALDLWAKKVREIVTGVSTTPKNSAKPESASATVLA